MAKAKIDEHKNDQPDEQIDARGLVCPLPILKTQKRLQAMMPGSLLEILADDPKAPNDLRHFVGDTGHTLVQLEENTEGMRAIIQRKA